MAGGTTPQSLSNRPNDVAVVEGKSEDIFKAYIPNFLYKPPYGMPRKVNTQQLKALAKNAYVFAVNKTLCDEVTSIPWKIQVKEDFQDDKVDYSEKIKEINKFLDNPNKNEQSFKHILRQVLTDILECDSGVIVKVFNVEGEMQQIFGRDGSLFLKNPDIYGYMGNKAAFVPPLPDGFTGVAIDVGGTPTIIQQQLMKNYAILYKEQAAYFQYGWTAGSMPVPFGLREIIYFMQNPRGDSIYGRSPIQVLNEIILNLVYGSEFNLDFYTNNNMPEGVIQLLGANEAKIKQFRENFEAQFKYIDSLGNKKKRFFSYPITSSEVMFTAFQKSAMEMQVLEQQEWFTKILWMCYGVTADEMGFTETSNKAVAESQTKLAKRKAVKPLLSVLEYHLNTQLIPEFFTVDTEMPQPGDVPLEFVFDLYDIEEDIQKHALYQTQIGMGIKTSEMVAKELGIDLVELKKSKDEAMKKQQEMFANGLDENGKPLPRGFGNDQDASGGNDEEPTTDGDTTPDDTDQKKKKKIEEKASPLREIENYIDDVEELLILGVNNLEDDNPKKYY